MKLKTLFIMIAAASLMSCTNSLENDIQGTWSIRSVTQNNNDTSSTNVQLVAFGWLNILSNNSKIKFNNKNEIYIDNQFKGTYKVIKDKFFILDSKQKSHEGLIVLSKDEKNMEIFFEKNIKVSLSKN